MFEEALNVILTSAPHNDTASASALSANGISMRIEMHDVPDSYSITKLLKSGNCILTPSFEVFMIAASTTDLCRSGGASRGCRDVGAHHLGQDDYRKK